MDEAENVKASGFPTPPASKSFSRVTAEFNNARFLRMHLKRKSLQSVALVGVKRGGVVLVLVLEADDDVVGVAHNHNIASWVGPDFVDTMIGLKARSGRMVFHGRTTSEVSREFKIKAVSRVIDGAETAAENARSLGLQPKCAS